MASRRIVLEMGMGTDIRGGDYTKAAIRAVFDALHHSSLGITRAIGADIESMHVEVMVGVQQPDKVDTDAVKATLPHGKVTVKAVKGGIDVPDENSGDFAIIANAAIVVKLDLP